MTIKEHTINEKPGPAFTFQNVQKFPQNYKNTEAATDWSK
jgi:hypothetical protein